MNVYDIATEVAEELHPNERGLQDMLGYVGVDDAVDFIVNYEFGKDYDELRDFCGEDRANALIEHYEAHCI